jgi:hypothetical protein
MKKMPIIISLLLLVLLFLTKCEKRKDTGLPTDGDGNTYDTVVIGTQVWLTENLKTTKYRNGNPIFLSHHFIYRKLSATRNGSRSIEFGQL